MFSLAHVHLLLNHIPIIVSGLGLLLIGLALARHDDHLARVAFALLAGGAIVGLPVYLTGESAEHAVRRLPDVSRELIGKHEDIALFAAIAIGVLGAAALWALWRFRVIAIPRSVVTAMFAGSLVVFGLMAYTGLIGGQIRHSEIRPGFVAPTDSSRR